MNAYRKNIYSLIYQKIKNDKPFDNVLDFGSGDGWFAKQFIENGIAKNIHAIDIKTRKNMHFKSQIYNGLDLPFEEESFDLVYSMDVLHHCKNPDAKIKELLKLSKSYFLLKDHTFENSIEWTCLYLMDIVGNLESGVDFVSNYQKEFNWFKLIESEGFKLEWLLHPASCHSGLLGKITNHLQFVGLWKRI